MALSPIDLQTLFVRLQQVGQDQAAIKDAAVQVQAVAGQEIVEKSRQQQSSVTETSEVPEGVEKTSEQDKGQEKQESENRRKQSKFHEQTNVVVDPDLGQNIDISG
ncbi:MAG TPA: hypothetical protein VMW73_07690 [Spirochaetia bacterium]|nr:hypothetical protein [Spirochaetia bacterium]